MQFNIGDVLVRYESQGITGKWRIDEIIGVYIKETEILGSNVGNKTNDTVNGYNHRLGLRGDYWFKMENSDFIEHKRRLLAI